MRPAGVILVVVVFGVAYASQNEDDFLKDAMELLEKCGENNLSICFKERALNYIEQLPANTEIADTIIIKPSENEKTGRHMTTFVLPEEPRAREEMLDNVIAEKLYEYFATHTFELKVPDDSTNDLQRSFEDEARKKKKKGVPIMLLLQLKAAAIGAIMLKFIGLVAFKALLVAKVALVLSLLLGLKKLLESKSHSSYEVVAHPVYSEDHGHFDRSFNQELPYRGYVEQSSTS